MVVNFYNPLRRVLKFKKEKYVCVGFLDFKKASKSNNLKVEKVIPQSKLINKGIFNKFLTQGNVYILRKE